MSRRATGNAPARVTSWERDGWAEVGRAFNLGAYEIAWHLVEFIERHKPHPHSARRTCSACGRAAMRRRCTRCRNQSQRKAA